MTVRENIAYPLKVRRLARDQVDQRVRDMLELVQLTRFIDRRPSELSGGQQQRVALARALVFKPEVLLLDEPMSALDKKLRVDLQEELRRIHHSLGTTFINVTHDQEEAMHMSDRIAVMNHGRIEQFDTAFTLYRYPASRFVADFVGKSNIFSGELVAGSGGLDFRGDGMEVRLGLTGPVAGKAELMIRGPCDRDRGPRRRPCHAPSRGAAIDLFRRSRALCAEACERARDQRLWRGADRHPPRGGEGLPLLRAVGCDAGRLRR
jgi:ABC-type Fe3+/spermidine/putrescine transport system ATPase subunit